MKEPTTPNSDSADANLNIKRLTAYKVAVSIIFGLSGFVLNFHTLNFPFPPYTATVLTGLLFPMLITLSWGWKYGLLSALAGGCQSMWWLWGPSNGYAALFVVPPFTLWIVWHGLIANLRIKQKTRKWWLSQYAVEVPFRILSTINLYTLSRWAITFNPPSWNWVSGAPNTIEMHFSHFVVIKQAVVGYIILLLADVLLNVGFVRRFFRLREDYNRAVTGYIISASLLIGFSFWVVDSVLDFLVFHTGSSFLDLVALNVPPCHLWMRTFFILTCLAGGLAAAKLLRKQRENQKELQKNAKALELSNRELEQFAYVASHDLQEPLRMVSSYVQLLARRYKGKLDADADDFIHFAVDGANRMQNLINDLLAFSRVGTRGKPFEPTDCEKVLKQALINLHVAIEESDAVATHDPLPTVMGDFSQLVQLFQNLIDNAIKFCGKDRPCIHISATWGSEPGIQESGIKKTTANNDPQNTSRESQTRRKKSWIFSVRDNGIGVDPEFFERIFIIFQRLHGREEYPGTGIGLAICKKIVERHGGRIRVESESGKGSVLWFTIPDYEHPISNHV